MLVSQMSFRGETTFVAARCRLFSRANRILEFHFPGLEKDFIVSPGGSWKSKVLCGR